MSVARSSSVLFEKYFPTTRKEHDFFQPWQRSRNYAVVTSSAIAKSINPRSIQLDLNKKGNQYSAAHVLGFIVEFWNVDTNQLIEKNFDEKTTTFAIVLKNFGTIPQKKQVTLEHEKYGLFLKGNKWEDPIGKVINQTKEFKDNKPIEYFFRAVKRIFGEHRVLSYPLEFDFNNSIVPSDEKDITLVSSVLHNCSISFDSDKFNLVDIENSGVEFTSRISLFDDFIQRFPSLQALQNHFFEVDNEFKSKKGRLENLRRQLQDSRRYSPGNKPNFEAMRKEIQEIENIKLIADALHSFHRIENWNQFQERALETLKFASPIEEFYCVFKVDRGVWPDGSLIERQTVEAIVITPNFVKKMLSI